jgi:hypothetical protein
VGDGQHEDAGTQDVKSGISTLRSRPCRIKPEAGKVAKDCAEPSSTQGGDIFDDGCIRFSLLEYTNKLRPSIARSPTNAEALPSAHVRNVLAGEPARDDVATAAPLAADLGHVVKHEHTGPVARQHSPAIRLGLGEYDRLRAPQPLQREVEPAYAREQRDDARAHAATIAANSTHSSDVRNAEAQVEGRAATRAVVEPQQQRSPSISHTPNCSAWPCSI